MVDGKMVSCEGTMVRSEQKTVVVRGPSFCFGLCFVLSCLLRVYRVRVYRVPDTRRFYLIRQLRKDTTAVGSHHQPKGGGGTIRNSDRSVARTARMYNCNCKGGG